ncbi:hypothetical protein [Chengkuizengella marina]|uniref:hypothetical protein n=1 Tax=Chengkuizengella marina TaxID=2507566 RepID=UPI00191BE1E6|nr:hypothetical protein [Chengkuizengella marina]
MKNKLMRHYCMNKTCGYEETNHKRRDAMKCPKCKGPVMSVDPKKKDFDENK